MLSGINQIEKEKTPADFTYVWNINNKANKQKRLMDTENKEVVTSVYGGSVKIGVGVNYTNLYKFKYT